MEAKMADYIRPTLADFETKWPNFMGPLDFIPRLEPIRPSYPRSSIFVRGECGVYRGYVVLCN
jgi:hypothetical protein